MIRGAPFRCALAVLLLAALTGCATRGFVRPVGTTVPFPEAIEVWTELTRGCRAVLGYRAQLRVSGRVNGERIPGLTAGLALDSQRIALEARYGGARVFTIAGAASDAVLLLHRDTRVVRGSAADIVDALVGVRLDAARLLALLTGCVTQGEVSGSDRMGSVARLTAPDAVVYLRQRGTSWHLVAGEIDDVTIDFRRIDREGVREIVIRRSSAVTLTLEVIEFERNPQLVPGLFHVAVPESFVETSLDALREGGPFGGRRD